MSVAVATMKGVELGIYIGDGNSPENFVRWCIINTNRGVNWQSAGSDEAIPFCDDPEAVAWTEHTATSKTGTITGNGKLDKHSVDNAWAWYDAQTPKNVRVQLGINNPLGYWEGRWYLTDWNITGDIGTKVESAMSLKSDGEQIWVPNS